MGRQLKLLISLILFFTANHLYAVIQLDDADTTFQVSDYDFGYYDASNKDIEVEKLIRKPRLFSTIQDQEYFGFGHQFEYWFKIKVWNVTPENRWVLFLNQPNAELMELFYFDENGKLQNKRSGVLIDDNEQEIQSPLAGFYLSHKADSPVEYYIKVKDSTSMIAPFYIVSLKKFFSLNKVLNFVTGTIIGMMALLLFFNLGMFIGTRQSIFLSYILFICLLDLILLHEIGVLSTFIGYWNLWYFKSIPVAMPLFLTSFLIFARQIILLGREDKTIWKLWIGFLLLQVPVFIATTLINNAPAFILSWIDSGVTMLFILVITGKYSQKENNLAGKIAFAAWLLNFILFQVNYLTKMNFFPADPGVTFYTAIFFSSENVIMSWVLVIWWNEEKEIHRRTASQLHRYKLRVLQNRMNPHFLFNSLNIIYSMIDAKFTKKASKSIMSLADIYHYLTNDAFEELISIEKEAEFLNKYLDFAQETLGKNISYEVNFASDTLKVLIPPMCIQPLVENSIKHGMSDKPLKIEVDVSKNQDGADILVTDNGKGYRQNSRSDTLDNIKERVSMHYKNVLFSIESCENGGARTKISFRKFKSPTEDFK